MHRQIDRLNWLEPDPHNERFITPMSGEQWLERILAPRLIHIVPKTVAELFEVARGAFVYGYLYYPLYFLGVAELQRVAEAAVKHRANELGMPPSKRKHGWDFDDNLKFLAGEEVAGRKLAIEAVLDYEDWKTIRDNRHFASHLKELTLISPDFAVMVLENTATHINALYSSANT